MLQGAYMRISNLFGRKWHPISTTPCNQELELRTLDENTKIITLEFPCLQINTGEWINVDLGATLKIIPIEWRIWRDRKSPDSHHSKIKPNDRSAQIPRHVIYREPDDPLDR